MPRLPKPTFDSSNPTYGGAKESNDQILPDVIMNTRTVAGGENHYHHDGLPADVAKGFKSVEKNMRSSTYTTPEESTTRGAARPWKPRGRS